MDDKNITTPSKEDYFADDYVDDTNDNYYDSDVQELLKELHLDDNASNENDTIKEDGEDEDIPIVNTDNDDSSVEINANNSTGKSKQVIRAATIRAASNLLLREANHSTSEGTDTEDEKDYVGIGCVKSCFVNDLSSSSAEGIPQLKDGHNGSSDDENSNERNSIDSSKNRRRRRRRTQRKKSNSVLSQLSSNNEDVVDDCDDILLKESERYKIPTITAPTTFHDQSLHGYFDSKLLSNMNDNTPLINQKIQEMALDNRIFLRTVLSLLSEYNITANKANSNNQQQPMKTGPLKKYSYLSRRWKIKFVEVRPGLLSYYEDELPTLPAQWIDNIMDHHHSNEQQNHPQSINKRFLNRKDIILSKHSTSCRKLDSDSVPPAVNIGENLNTDYVFEILCQEDSASSTCIMKKLWMAHTKEERNSWIEVIQRAMEHTTPSKQQTNHLYNPFIPTKSSTYEWDSYKKAKIQSQKISSSINYILPEEKYTLCNELFHMLYDHKAYYINLDWWLLYNTKDNPQQFEEYYIPDVDKDDIKDVSLIWKLLSKKHTVISLNGVKFHANAHPFIPEQVMGSIVRCIMEIIVLKLSSSDDEVVYTGKISDLFQRDSNSDNYRMDMQAIIFARDIVLSACKYLLVESDVYQSAVYDVLTSLFESPFTIAPVHEYHRKIVDISITTPSSYDTKLTSPSIPQPSAIPTSPKNRNDLKKIDYPNTKSGWVNTRMKNNKRYKQRYCILSDNVISFYEYDTPRPHGLKSQLVLTKQSHLQISSIHNESAHQHCYIITIFTNKEKIQRQFQIYFDDVDYYIEWKAALHSSISLLQQKYKQSRKNDRKELLNRERSLDSVSLPSLEEIDLQDNNLHASAETIRIKNKAKTAGTSRSTTPNKLKTNVSMMIRDKLQQHRGNPLALPSSNSTTYNAPSSPRKAESNTNLVHDSPIATKKKQLQSLLKKGRSSFDGTIDVLPPPSTTPELQKQQPIAQIEVTSVFQKYKIQLKDETLSKEIVHDYYSLHRKDSEKNVDDFIFVQSKIVQYYFLYNVNDSDSNNGCYLKKGEEVICFEFC